MDGGTWKRNLAALWVAQALTMLAFSIVFPFLPLYVLDLGVTGTAEAAQWAAAIITAAAISMIIAQPVWGHLSDKYGRRPMVIRSMFGASICVLAMGLVVSPEQLLVARLIQGAITGTVAASNALVASSAPKERLGFSLGLMQVALFSGSSLGPLVGGLVADNLGYRYSFFLAAALMFIGGWTVVLLVRERFTRPDPQYKQPGIIASSRSLFANGSLRTVLVVIFFIQFGAVVMAPVLSLFIAQLSRAENAATAAGIVLGAGGAMGAVSAIVVGRMGDRIGHSLILPICLAGAAIVYIPQAFVQEVWQLLVLRLALGCFLGGLMPSANAILARVVPAAKRGAAFGLSGAAFSVANASGLLLGAGVASAYGLQSVFLVTGGMFALAYAWVALQFRRHPLGKVKAEPALVLDSGEPL